MLDDPLDVTSSGEVSDYPVRLLVHSDIAFVEELESSIDVQSGDDLVTESADPFARDLASTIVESIQVTAMSGAALAALRSIVVALISSRRARVVIERDDARFELEGPPGVLADMEKTLDDLFGPDTRPR